MGYQEHAELGPGGPDLAHPGGDDPQGVDVEAGVGFVQHGEIGLQHRHLQDFVTLLSPRRKTRR